MPRSHGASVGYQRTPEYATWLRIRDRVKRKPEYAGRGIKLCARWADSFPAFLSDVGQKPSPELTIERIDNDRDYEPGNVRWATIKEQTRNRRTTRSLTVNGVSRCLAEWAEISGLPIGTIHSRIGRDGWSAERAVLTPRRGTATA